MRPPKNGDVLVFNTDPVSPCTVVGTHDDEWAILFGDIPTGVEVKKITKQQLVDAIDRGLVSVPEGVGFKKPKPKKKKAAPKSAIVPPWGRS